jgi:hypothetical protein
MVDGGIDTRCEEDGGASTARANTLAEQSAFLFFLPTSTCSKMSVSLLAAQCRRELSNYRRGEPCNETYGLELLRRATVQGDQEAWAGVQEWLGGLVRDWLRRHPRCLAACRLESEENYMAQAFGRFWQATTTQHLEFKTLAAALQYLRASLNGAILDALRAYSRPREISLPGPDGPQGSYVEDSTGSGEVWEILQTMLHTMREQQLAYLLFHCGLKPREIVRLCPQEWSSVGEIYQLRRDIIERLRRTMDHLRWRLS